MEWVFWLGGGVADSRAAPSRRWRGDKDDLTSIRGVAVGERDVRY